MVDQFEDHSLSVEGNIIWKYMELIVLVNSCEKPQQFALTEWSNFSWLTVRAPVLVNCTWNSKDERALPFNTGFINKCIYSPI